MDGRLLGLALALSCGAACSSTADDPASTGQPAGSAPPGSPAASTPAASSGGAPRGSTAAGGPRAAPPPPPPREGGALVRATSGDALYVADEDRSVVRRIPLPVAEAAAPPPTPVPGRPAQVLARGDDLLVTIRQPGMLLVLGRSSDGGLAETARIPLPDDAWGVALTPDGKTAVVTSAWTHQVSVVDLAEKKVRFSVDVAREPRGVTVRADGKAAYVSHLASAALTRVPLDGPTAATRVALPAAPLRTPLEATLGASLGYSLTLSADGERIYAARHALGAPGDAAWFGAATIDVLLADDERPLIPARAGKPIARSAFDGEDPGDTWLATPLPSLVQPRAMVYRRKTSTLIVASEGTHALLELEARAIDPTVLPVFEQPLGSVADPTEPAPTRCGAPTGVALSTDEDTAFVWCRATGDLAIVDLRDDPAQPGHPVEEPLPRRSAEQVRVVHLADDPLPPIAARGRRVFYDAADTITSGGLGCAGCHPEGRDDGHVWLEVQGPMTRAPIFVGGASILAKGAHPRQTPMLAGRVASPGPYGWHAQNDDLVARILEGVRLHRWLGPGAAWDTLETAARQRATALAEFLRSGLVPPPQLARPLTPEEQRGQELFASQETGCAGCHVPGTEYTNRIAAPLKQAPPAPPFAAEANNAFKTPSLFFVGGTPPYFHDGSARTLEEVIEANDDRMGRTNHLSAPDRAALVAFLRTL